MRTSRDLRGQFNPEAPTMLLLTTATLSVLVPTGPTTYVRLMVQQITFIILSRSGSMVIVVYLPLMVGEIVEVIDVTFVEIDNEVIGYVPVPQITRSPAQLELAAR